MAERVVQALLEVVDSDGATQKYPVFKSHYLQLERRTGRAMPRGTADMVLMAYRIVHGSWPATDDDLDEWFDTVDKVDIVKPDGKPLDALDVSSEVEQLLAPLGLRLQPTSSPG